MTVGRGAAVPDWARSYFSEEDCREIERAVRAAELHTEGEIVPVVVRASLPRWPTTSLMTFGLILIGMLVNDLFGLSGYYAAVQLVFSVGLALLISKWDSPHRWIAPRDWVEEEVRERAELEFYRARIHHTQKKTGILIFLSLAERRAIVLGDSAISARLDQQVWDGLVHRLVLGIRKGNSGQSLAQAVQECGEILSKEFPRSANDQDELHNNLVFKS